MFKTKKEKLEKAGWTVGTTEQFLGKTEKDLYKEKVIHTFSTVFDVLYEYDIEGFLKMGAPVDEYSHEAWTITGFLCADEKNKDRLKYYVVDFFQDQFSIDEEALEEYEKELGKMCEEILKRLEQ